MKWLKSKIDSFKEFWQETKEMKREDWKELGAELWATFKPDLWPLAIFVIASFIPGRIAAFFFGFALFWLIGNMVEHRAKWTARREVIAILKDIVIKVEKTEKPEPESGGTV